MAQITTRLSKTGSLTFTIWRCLSTFLSRPTWGRYWYAGYEVIDQGTKNRPGLWTRTLQGPLPSNNLSDIRLCHQPFLQVLFGWGRCTLTSNYCCSQALASLVYSLLSQISRLHAKLVIWRVLDYHLIKFDFMTMTRIWKIPYHLPGTLQDILVALYRISQNCITCSKDAIRCFPKVDHKFSIVLVHFCIFVFCIRH